MHSFVVKVLLISYGAQTKKNRLAPSAIAKIRSKEVEGEPLTLLVQTYVYKYTAKRKLLLVSTSVST